VHDKSARLAIDFTDARAYLKKGGAAYRPVTCP
jgi:hypothetical protein